jgi:hypothetical protein
MKPLLRRWPGISDVSLWPSRARPAGAWASTLLPEWRRTLTSRPKAIPALPRARHFPMSIRWTSLCALFPELWRILFAGRSAFDTGDDTPKRERSVDALLIREATGNVGDGFLRLSGVVRSPSAPKGRRYRILEPSWNQDCQPTTVSDTKSIAKISQYHTLEAGTATPLRTGDL